MRDVHDRCRLQRLVRRHEEVTVAAAEALDDRKGVGGRDTDLRDQPGELERPAHRLGMRRLVRQRSEDALGHPARLPFGKRLVRLVRMRRQRVCHRADRFVVDDVDRPVFAGRRPAFHVRIIACCSTGS